MVESSPGAASWLWIAAALYLLFEMWRGWRRGVVRHGVSVFALLAAGGVGWIFAWMTGFVSDRVIPLPVPAGRLIFGLFTGLVFYAAAVVLSSLLFKKTSQQSSGLVRLFYGAGGAFFGLIFGLLVLWGGISMLRAVGAVAAGEQALMVQSGAAVPGLDADLASVARPLQGGSAGRVADKLDVVPPNIYAIITKLVQVTGSPEATARFFAYPGTQKLLAESKLQGLFTDPDLVRAASEGNYLALLANPKLAEIASDPAVQKSFTGFDLEKALDHALQLPPSSPVP
jgi:CBS domain-containing protein